jgi:hypothetical protein
MAASTGRRRATRSIFSICRRNADVVGSEEVIVFLKSLPAQQYDLPPGPR